MTKVDAALLQQAQSLQMVIQYGVGVEGIDITEASATRVNCVPSRAIFTADVHVI